MAENVQSTYNLHIAVGLDQVITDSKQGSTVTTNLCAGSEQQLRSQGSEFPSRADPHKPIILLSCLLRIIRSLLDPALMYFQLKEGKVNMSTFADRAPILTNATTS